MSNDNNGSDAACFVMLLFVAFIIAAIYCAMYVTFLLFLFAISATVVITFLTGITVMFYHLLKNPKIVIDGEVVKYNYVSLKNYSVNFRQAACAASLETAMFLHRSKRRINNEDIFVLNQKKHATTPVGCLIPKTLFWFVPKYLFIATRYIFWGGENKGYMTEEDYRDPTQNEYVKMHFFSIGFAIVITSIFVMIQTLFSVIGAGLFYLVKTFLYWPSKKTHNGHVYFTPHLRCRCGRIHCDLAPSITGAGVFSKECVCGNTYSTFNTIIGRGLYSSSFEPICPRCDKE